MYNILILSHGPLAEAYRETLGMFTASMNGIHAAGFDGADPEAFSVRVRAVLDQLPAGEELLILCDLFGGTPFNTVMREADLASGRVEVLSGVNLPLLIEASMFREEPLGEVKARLKQSGKDAVMEIADAQVSDEDE